MSKLFPKKIVNVTWDDEPHTKYVRGATEDRLILVDDFKFTVWFIDGTSVTYTIYAGFRFEGSVPSWAWSIAKISSDSAEAQAGFCIHDWCYTMVKYHLVERSEADLILKITLYAPSGAIVHRYNIAQVTVVYQAVDKFGWIFANKKVTDAEAKEVERNIKEFAA